MPIFSFTRDKISVSAAMVCFSINLTLEIISSTNFLSSKPDALILTLINVPINELLAHKTSTPESITELRFIALDIGVKRIQSTGIKGHIEFNETPQINANTLINLIQVHSTRYKLQGPKRLNFVLDAQHDLARIQEIIALLKTLSN